MTDPDPASAVSRPDRRRRRPRSGRRALVGSLVALAVVVLVASAALARTSSGPAYRTAAVVRATVAEQIRTSGTIEPVAEASVSFPTSGTVASVAVNVGDTVRTGQLLATLDTTSLQATLDQRNATLAQAKLTLANAEVGESSSGGSGSGASNGSGSGSGGSGGTGSTSAATGTADTASTTTTAARSASGPGSTGSPTTGTGSLAAAQQAVTDDQQQLDRDLALARADLAAAQAACADPSSSPGAGSTTTSTTPGTAATSAACLNAQRQLLTDQTAVSNTETSLAGAERALDALLSSAASAASNASSSSNSSSSSTAASAASSTDAANSSSTSTPSAQELVADQAAVDAADAAVAVAQQGLDQASIVSPINGTVAAVGLAAGDSVSADSSTQAVVVAGPGGYEVATTLSVSNRTKLELGDAATVVADGSTQVLSAQVVAIGVAGTTSGTTTTYPVVVGFSSVPDGSLAGLRNGASASVTIELASVVAATAVPTSAVHTTGTTHTVTVLDGSTTKAVKVTTGVVGAQLTQIKTGLHVGQVVVLADLSQALPSSDSTSTSRRSGLGGGGLTTGSGGFTGGFGGTGGPPAGPGGG